MDKRPVIIKNILEKLYKKYNHYEFIKPDPLQFIYKYDNQADMEIAGFLAAALAYGRVQQIEKSLTNLLGSMGTYPSRFVRNFMSEAESPLDACVQFVQAVKDRSYPAPEHCFS